MSWGCLCVFYTARRAVPATNQYRPSNFWFSAWDMQLVGSHVAETTKQKQNLVCRVQYVFGTIGPLVPFPVLLSIKYTKKLRFCVFWNVTGKATTVSILVSWRLLYIPGGEGRGRFGALPAFGIGPPFLRFCGVWGMGIYPMANTYRNVISKDDRPSKLVKKGLLPPSMW